jgi:hypothetical protein
MSEAMRDQTLFRMLGVAAIVGGALRVGSAFIPWSPNDVWLEALAFVIDVLLLFGLMGLYFAHRAKLGLAGFAAFALAEIGIASIVGPDTSAFGIDTYQAGVAAISLSLSLLAIVMLTRRAGPMLAAACWIASTIVGIAGSALGLGELGFLAGGVLFGLGFVAAGWALASPRDRIEEAA